MMRLTKMLLRNYRCFADFGIEFDERLTVIIAENGAGKTALLDAIAIGFGRYLTKLPGVTGITSKPSDIRVEKGEQPEKFMMLAWEAKTIESLVEKPISWIASRKRDGMINQFDVAKTITEQYKKLYSRGQRELDAYSTALVRFASDDKKYFLPVVAYYGTNRAIREEVRRRRGFKKSFSRFEALAGALDPDSRFRAAFEWFNAMEDAERREKLEIWEKDYQNPILKIVRTAIERLLGSGYKNLRTETRPLRLVIDKVGDDGATKTLRVSQLSDGYRVVLGLVMDLARRMAQANAEGVPEHMQGTSPLDMPAIVLIDEIDLHLHPSWQQRIIPDLMQTFPKTQFIVTTHSPQVLSTIRRENIRVLGTDADGHAIAEPPLAMTYGEPSGDVMHSVMLVDPQPPVPEKALLNRLTWLVDQGLYASEEAINLMNQVTRVLGEQHPQIMRLHRSIRRQEILWR